MNKNIVIVLAIVFAVAIGLVFWFFGPKQAAQNPGTLQMSVVSVKDASSKLYAIDAEYPQFGGAPASFNSEIADFVNNRITEFKKASAENWQARQDTRPAGEPKQEFPAQPFYFESNWEPEQLNQNYISSIVRFSEYIGGANENQNLRTFNYDFVDKREVALADVFPGVPDYLQKISDIVRSSLTSQLDAASNGHVATDILNQGTEPTEENFSNFVFNDNVITFYFPKYQVAPGVFGEQYVPVLISSVK
ncbi:MAG: DUF3298 domain-containing protein [Minisyncoccia bacterium]|jgi:hypothetical protein